MIESMILTLSRETLIGLLSADNVDITTLRACVCAALGGNPAELLRLSGPTAMPTATVAAGAVTTNGATQPVAALGPAPSTSPVAIALDALLATGQGFAISDLASASGQSKAVCHTALKNAIKAGRAASAGEKRFFRYGATVAIASAASNGAKASASGPTK